MVFSALDLCQLGEPSPPASTYWLSQPFWKKITLMPAARAAVMARLMLAITGAVVETSNPAKSKYPPCEA
ncbi:hypothetical protein D3C87_2139860 [compost metagenome]